MTVPPELDTKIRLRFLELIGVAEYLVENTDDEFYLLSQSATSDYEGLIVNACNLVNMVFAGYSGGKDYLKRLNDMAGKTSFSRNCRRIAGILTGLKEDYENGYCDTLEKWISAEINTDYLQQAIMLFDQGKSEELDHVLSAVVCGIVLENSLRWLCSQQSPVVKTVRQNRQPKRLNALIDDLQKAKAFNAMKGDQLRGWAKTRNHAAHGETDEFNRQDVQSMISGVRDFLAEYIYGK